MINLYNNLMSVEQKIEKIFGSNYIENEFQSKFEKSQHKSNFLSNSSKKSESKFIKPKKFFVNSFKKQFINIENKNIKKDKKKTIGYININCYSEFFKNLNQNDKEKSNIEEIIWDSNKIKNKKTIINPLLKESNSTQNLIYLKNINKNTEEKFSSTSNEKKNSKSKKKKETTLNRININNNIYNPLKIRENKNKLNEIQTVLQFEIKSKIYKYKDYKIEKIKIPNFLLNVKEENKLNNNSNNNNSINNNEANLLNPTFKNEYTSETKNNFQILYKVNNKKSHFLCCI